MDLAAEWLDRLHAEADGYARLALENIAREFPALLSALMTAPGQFPRRPRDRTPVFYGSFDWHSCVEMHWVLVRLLQACPDAVPAAGVRSALDAQFTYPGGWEPSGSDFLSPGLAEAELMARLLPAGEFGAWLGTFLPGLAAGEPGALFTPAVVSDSSDGQIAHLHGLNLSRAWCWRRLAETLPAADPRVPVCAAAARTHAEAALPHVVADHYMVTHWLAAYAVLLFS